jgi:hypothetical protein
LDGGHGEGQQEGQDQPGHAARHNGGFATVGFGGGREGGDGVGDKQQEHHEGERGGSGEDHGGQAEAGHDGGGGLGVANVFADGPEDEGRPGEGGGEGRARHGRGGCAAEGVGQAADEGGEVAEAEGAREEHEKHAHQRKGHEGVHCHGARGGHGEKDGVERLEESHAGIGQEGGAAVLLGVPLGNVVVLEAHEAVGVGRVDVLVEVGVFAGLADAAGVDFDALPKEGRRPDEYEGDEEDSAR